MTRRGIRLPLLAAAVLLGASPRPPAAYAGPASRAERRLANRVELWAAFADGTRPLAARFELVRHTALLREPFRTSGAFEATPDGRLRFAAGDGRGATTILEPEGRVRIELPSGDVRTVDDPSARWFAGLLRRLFVPEGEAREDLVAGDRVSVPKGRGMRLEFRPPPSPGERAAIRAVVVHLDPVAGHVARIDVFEASGDRVEIRFVDVRRPNVTGPTGPP